RWTPHVSTSCPVKPLRYEPTLPPNPVLDAASVRALWLYSATAGRIAQIMLPHMGLQSIPNRVLDGTTSHRGCRTSPCAHSDNAGIDAHLNRTTASHTMSENVGRTYNPGEPTSCQFYVKRALPED